MLLLLAATVQAEPDLDAIETKWVQAALPVLDFAQAQGLAVDVVVKSTSEANDVALSMGVQDERCKLVLSLRGNPDAEATLTGIPVEQHPLFIEAMAAHELAHCWRYTQGMWHTLPAGFTESVTSGDDEELAMKKRAMRATRREEGFADLLALAWTLNRHPNDYATVHAWLTGVRKDQPMLGSYHDTRAWLRLAKSAAAFPAVPSLFEQVQSVWLAGLRAER